MKNVKVQATLNPQYPSKLKVNKQSKNIGIETQYIGQICKCMYNKKQNKQKDQILLDNQVDTSLYLSCEQNQQVWGKDKVKQQSFTLKLQDMSYKQFQYLNNKKSLKFTKDTPQTIRAQETKTGQKNKTLNLASFKKVSSQFTDLKSVGPFRGHQNSIEISVIDDTNNQPTYRQNIYKDSQNNQKLDKRESTQKKVMKPIFQQQSFILKSSQKDGFSCSQSSLIKLNNFTKQSKLSSDKLDKTKRDGNQFIQNKNKEVLQQITKLFQEYQQEHQHFLQYKQRLIEQFKFKIRRASNKRKHFTNIFFSNKNITNIIS